MARPVRVLVAKAGLDGHDRGAKVVARILRDAGMEVVYSGAHMSLVPRIVEKLRASGAGDVAVVIGGVIPDDDIESLRNQGIADVFPQDTPPDVIVTRIRELAAARPLE